MFSEIKMNEITEYEAPLTVIAEQADSGLTLRKVVERRLGVSRKLLSRLKLTERGIERNGERVHVNVIIRAGDRIELRLAKEASEDLFAQRDIQLDIIAEDEYLMLVNKPAGMIVHPTIGHYTGTLANYALGHWQARGEQVRFRPIHRLDEQTSGLVAIAKNKYVHQQVSEQLIRHEVHKKYVALVYGIPASSSGRIEAPIDRHPVEFERRIVPQEGGAHAVTHYRVIETYGTPEEGAAMLELVLETGRTHQIRVHLLHIGHGIIGDQLYLSDAAPINFERAGQALHAVELSFVHPMDGQRHIWRAPYPADFTKLREDLLLRWQS